MQMRIQLSVWIGIFLTGLVLFSVSAPRAVLAGQEVRVLVVAGEGADGTVSRGDALAQALRQGVFQEAEDLLRGGPAEPRRALLQGVLAGKASEYVLGYSELGYELTAWGAVLSVDVMVNRPALRAFLQSLGVYYTLNRSLDYRLETELLSPEDEALVRDMEILSGLNRASAGPALLRLGRAADGGWQGALEFGDQTRTALAPDLAGLWTRLWGEYFSSEQVRRDFVSGLLLITRGWSGAVDVLGFDHVLRSWDLLAGEVRIAGVTLDARGVEARWEITTMNPAALEARLNSALQGMNISYSIEPR